MTHLGSPHDAYDIIEQIGDGSFGTVHKARNKISHKLVAVKIMKKKYSCIEECAGQFEPKLLTLLPVHLNIVQLYDSFLSPVSCDLSFIMEYMDGGNLYQLMRERRNHGLPFNHCELRNILFQILSAVSHIHHHHIFHRDMKPENLLLDYSTGRPILKLADFGLARELKSQPPYTEYVSTRWYRAPEVLLRSTEYSAPVDLWAIGAIFAELITLEPLFPGESEIDQIYRICDILGSPGNKLGVGVGQKSKPARQEKRLSPGFARKKTKDVGNSDVNNVNVVATNSTISILDGGGEWKEGVKLAYKIGFKFPQLSPKPLESVIPNATESMIDLIRHFLFFNPNQRRSADAALKHVFFSEASEPVHKVIPMEEVELEPLTPPDKQQDPTTVTAVAANDKPLMREITPLDLLSIPRTPYQVCPDWNTDHPVSRYGRLCSAIKEDTMRPPSSRGTHHHIGDAQAADGGNAWLAQSRPIYSSHQKVHPVSDRPNSSNLWNKYNYAAHQRPQTPVIEHINSVGHGHHNDHVKAPPTPSATISSKRYSTLADELDTHRRLGHHYHHDHDNYHLDNHHHHLHKPTSAASATGLDRLPHYGSQLVKWAPPPQHGGVASNAANAHASKATSTTTSPAATTTTTYHYHQPQPYQDPELARPESRRCRSPAPFSSQLMKHKYTTSTNTSTNNLSSAAPIKYWTPPTTTTNINTDKVMVTSDGDLSTTLTWGGRKSDKPQSTHRNSTSHRFNLWVPEAEEDEDEEEKKNNSNVNNLDRSVVIS